MQYGFMPGRGTVDVVFILRRLQESIAQKARSCFMYLLIWKKRFQLSTTESDLLCFRKRDVSEYSIQGFISFYSGHKTAVFT